MWQIVKDNPRAVLYAVLVHLVMIGLLMINVDWSSMTKVAPQHSSAPVQARVVEEDLLQQELQRQQELEVQQRAAEAERQRQLEEQAAEARRQREREEQRLADLKRQQAEEVRRQQEAKVKAEAEAKRKTETEAKVKAEAEAKRKAEAEVKARAEAEAKRKAEAEVKARAEAEAKRKAETEAKARAEAEAKRKAEAEVKARAEEEARQRAVAAAINQYTALIHDRVRRNWRLPANWRGLSCVVRVNLIPGGDVVSVRIVQSSGDPVFDRSVESAVFQAAPLPVPSEPHLFDAFREFNFRFDPN
jgi:colicin import membrane protein